LPAALAAALAATLAGLIAEFLHCRRQFLGLVGQFVLLLGQVAALRATGDLRDRLGKGLLDLL